MRYELWILPFVLCASNDVVCGQVDRAAASGRAAAGNFAAGQAAAQAATLSALALRNAENRRQTLAAYARTPPIKEYSRLDQKVFVDEIQGQIDRLNNNREEDYKERLTAYSRDLVAWRDSQATLKSAKTGFLTIGSTGQISEESLKVSQRISQRVFLNLDHSWLIELQLDDVTDMLADGTLATDELVFTLVGIQPTSSIAQKYGVTLDANWPNRIHLIEVKGGGAKRVPKPIQPQLDDPPADARPFEIGGKTVVCSYIKRLRVRNRKYDVFFAVESGGEYRLAWVPYGELGKEDQKWLGLEDRRRATLTGQ